jgi:hypothetical protein
MMWETDGQTRTDSEVSGQRVTEVTVYNGNIPSLRKIAGKIKKSHNN